MPDPAAWLSLFYVFQHFHENVLRQFHRLFIVLSQRGDNFLDVLFVRGKVLVAVGIDEELVDTDL